MTINIARTPVGSLKQIYCDLKYAKTEYWIIIKMAPPHMWLFFMVQFKGCVIAKSKRIVQQIIYKRTELSLQPHYLHNKGSSENVIAPMI